MLGTNNGIQRDFRLKGYTEHNMFSPRQPVINPGPTQATKAELREAEMVKYFGKSGALDPSKPRVDENHRGMLYGDHDYDRGHPHPRPLGDVFTERSNNNEAEKYQRQKHDMEMDIQQMKNRQMKEKSDREYEKKQNYEVLTKTFPWDKNRGGGAPRGSGGNRRKKFLETDFHAKNQEGYKDTADFYKVSRKKETDLFLNTLGGPGGTVMRGQDGSPGLTDPRTLQLQQNFPQQSPRMNSQEMQDYSKKIEQVNEEKRMAKQQRKMHDLRNQIDEYQGEGAYKPDFSKQQTRPTPRRSLDLEGGMGGAGAPVRDARGKPITRKTITLSRDDFGESRIREDMPSGTRSLDFSLEEDQRPYHPWGGQGGGAPVRDGDGNVKTMVYGKLNGRDTGSGEVRRTRRRQEMLYNELKIGEDAHNKKKQEETRYMKAPQANVADILLAGEVGRPKRDAITGEHGQHHLNNSDVSLMKMNYQGKTIEEKRALHDDLMQMADERKHANQLEKLKEKQESNAHFAHMDRNWGHYGGGAPKHNAIKKKANLTNALFYPDAEPQPSPRMMIMDPPTGLGSFLEGPGLPSYQKVYVEGDVRQHPPSDQSPRFVKSTLGSTHRNMFDANPEYRVSPRGHMPPPYATGAGLY